MALSDSADASLWRFTPGTDLQNKYGQKSMLLIKD